MKYIVVVAQEATDGTIGPSMTAYDSYTDAQSAYHMELAYGAVSDKLSSDMAMLADTTGHVYETCVVQGLAKPVEAPSVAGGDTAETTSTSTTEDKTTE